MNGSQRNLRLTCGIHQNHTKMLVSETINHGDQLSTQPLCCSQKVSVPWSVMTLSYQVIVERYPFPNGVVGKVRLPL